MLFAGDDVGRFLDDFVVFGKDELDVARVGHVGIDLRHFVSFLMPEPKGSYRVDIHDRVHGMCAFAASVPG
jgi:hypothetical protein